MKKIIAAIIAIVVVFAVALGAESSFSKEKIDFVGEAENIEYYFEKMYLYNTMQDEFNATANLLDINTRVVALNENEKIQFKLPHKPLRIYELAANEKGDRIKVDYDKVSRLYTLSDLQSSEVSEYNIVADYGLIKNIYCFRIYNKTFIEKNKTQKTAAELVKSAYDISESNEKIIVKTNGTNYQGPRNDSITIDGLSFCYDEKKPILKDASFRFEKGKKYALIGPSGCGKSTLLKILLGWLPEYQGTIRFDGRDIREYTPEQLQQQMSYIEQNVFLFNASIRENITLDEAVTEEQLRKAIHDSALENDLLSMPNGLDTLVGEGGCNISGGQKQRVAIARALIHERSILLVDEGTSALDAQNADLVEKSLLANPNLTLILISHHLSDKRKAQFDCVYELMPTSSRA